MCSPLTFYGQQSLPVFFAFFVVYIQSRVTSSVVYCRWVIFNCNTVFYCFCGDLSFKQQQG